ncbi:MAG: DNA primase, partial [Arsenophonus sp. ER-EMS1-MAG3]
QLEKLATWNDIEIKDIAEKLFQDALKHLFTIVLNEKFEFLIAKERTEGLTNEERKEVHLITIKKIEKNRKEY